MNRLTLGILGALIVVVGIVVSSGLFIVRETEQALVLQFGDPKRVVQEPGLKMKIPFIQNVIRYDSRILGLDPEAEEVQLIDQKRIIVDAFARYRIVDPLLYFQSVRTEDTFNGRFGNILNAAVRRIVAQRSQVDLLSETRASIMRSIFTEVDQESKDFGVELVDIRIGRTELPEEVSQNVFGRMQTEREREAALLRAEGEEEARRIRARADRTQIVILAEANRKSSILRGEGDAERNRILGEAFGKDQEFFDFFRTLEAYRTTLANDDTTMVISPTGDFFRYFGLEAIGGEGPSAPR